jgi:hypothetical protein
MNYTLLANNNVRLVMITTKDQHLKWKVVTVPF